MTSIRYFIPEDGDNEHQPNVFLAPKSRQQGTPPTLGQVKQAFPLPGKYHFRFKTSLGGGPASAAAGTSALAVWMDCTDDRQPVFVWKNQIVAKVTRIGIEDDEDDDDDDDEDFRRPNQHQHQSAPTSVTSQPQQTIKNTATTTTTTPTSGNMNQQRNQQQYPTPSQTPHVSVSHSTSSPSFDIFDADHRPTVATVSSTVSSSGDLLGGHHHHHQSSGSSNLLDMNFGGVTTSSTSSSHHNDFLGMTAAPSPPVSGNFNAFQPGIQQQQQQPSSTTMRPPSSTNQFQSSQTRTTTFDSFTSNSTDAFGGLGTPWK